MRKIGLIALLWAIVPSLAIAQTFKPTERFAGSNVACATIRSTNDIFRFCQVAGLLTSQAWSSCRV